MDPALLQQLQPAPILGTFAACFLLWLVGMQIVVELGAVAALFGGAALGALAHQGQMPPWGPAALQGGATLLAYRLLFVRRAEPARKGRVELVPARTVGGLQFGRTLVELLTFWMSRRFKARLGLSGEDAGSTIYSSFRR